MMERMAQRSLHAGARVLTARRLEVEVQGLHHLPPTGPLLIAARHVHHLYDGCVLLAAAPRPLHLLVALDWAETRRTRRLMEWACATARWPVILRPERLRAPHVRSAYRPEESVGYLRRATHGAVALLCTGHALVVFPEAYPNVDPVFTPKPNDEAFLPFRPGFVRLVARAQRDGHTCVPIVPAGLTYRRGQRWRVRLRFGPPLLLAAGTDRADRVALVREVEAQVRVLSAPAPCRRTPALWGQDAAPAPGVKRGPAGGR